jgi:hypothetical protein
MSESAEVKRRAVNYTIVITGKVSNREENLILEELKRIVPDPLLWIMYSGQNSRDRNRKAFRYKAIIL